MDAKRRSFLVTSFLVVTLGLSAAHAEPNTVQTGFDAAVVATGAGGVGGVGGYRYESESHIIHFEGSLGYVTKPDSTILFSNAYSGGNKGAVLGTLGLAATIPGKENYGLGMYIGVPFFSGLEMTPVMARITYLDWGVATYGTDKEMPVQWSLRGKISNIGDRQGIFYGGGLFSVYGDLRGEISPDLWLSVLGEAGYVQGSNRTPAADAAPTDAQTPSNQLGNGIYAKAGANLSFPLILGARGEASFVVEDLSLKSAVGVSSAPPVSMLTQLGVRKAF